MVERSGHALAEGNVARLDCPKASANGFQEKLHHGLDAFDLFAAADAIDAPFAKVLAVIGEKAVPVFPKSGASAGDDLVRCKGATVGGFQ